MTNPARRGISSASYVDYDYDRFYASHDFDYTERVEDAFLRAILHGLVRLPAGATILDLGCGTGFDTWLMDRMGFRALGVDISQVGIEKARQRGGSARFALADALTAHAEIGRDWDLVYCSGFMAFNWVSSLEEPAAMEAAGALLQYARPGGWLVFVWDSLLTGERWSPYTDVAPDRMFMNYTVQQIRRLWESVGECQVRYAAATHKRLTPILGRRAFSRIVTGALPLVARRLRRPLQVVAVIQRAMEAPAQGEEQT